VLRLGFQMSEESFAKFEAFLEELRGRLERIEARLQPEPRCLSYPDAAARLGVGLTKLKRMVKAGELKPTLVGRVKMVALSEIHRVSTPEAERPALAKAQAAEVWVPIPKRKR
jgi:hypothetical protein